MSDPEGGPFELPRPGETLLVLAPHPDDECLAAAGLMQRAHRAGIGVVVAFMTDGDNAPWIQRVFERRWRIGPQDRARFGALRRVEAARALAALGLPPDAARFLHWPDQGITPALLGGDETPVDQLQALLESVRPRLVLAPSAQDLHPDHSALSVLLDLACERLAPDARPRRETFLIHRLPGPPPTAARSRWLTPEESACKRQAISAYASQLSVHRKHFLAFQSVAEDFAPAPGPQGGAPGHAIEQASWEDGQLRLTIRLRARLGSHGPAALLLLGAQAGRQRWCLRRPLRRRGHGGEIRLDAADLPPHDSLHVKVERARGFFDQAGWLQIPPAGVVPAPPAAVPARAITLAVIPCFNVAALCRPVVRRALEFADRVLVVDDGSTDGTAEVLAEEVAGSAGRMRLLRLPVNRGKGAALLAAFRLALAEEDFDVLVTLDGDGQHRPQDIPALAAAARAGASLVVGGRQEFAKMPLRSRFGNTLTSWILRRALPGCPQDTQSGFRAHRRALIEAIVRRIPGHRYETELRILLLALRGRQRVAELPIPTLYFDGNRSSHYQPVRDSLRIVQTLLVAWLHT